MPGTVKTTRLRKCACGDCGYVARISRTWLERGLPGCPCGGRLIPADLEDALAAHAAGHLTDAELETHPEHWTYVRERERIERGRTGAHKWGEDLRRDTAKTRTGRLSADELALERVEAGRAVERNRARHAALAAHAFGAADKAAAAADMPF
jgi:hypothetical protein